MIGRGPPPRKGAWVEAELRLRPLRCHLVPSPMEDPMCWEMDYYWLAEQRKTQEAQQKKEQRTELIDKLLSEASREVDRAQEAKPAKETIPAK
jgi:hypothetical protein